MMSGPPKKKKEIFRRNGRKWKKSEGKVGAVEQNEIAWLQAGI